MPGHVEERNSLTFFQEARLIVSGLDRSDPQKNTARKFQTVFHLGDIDFKAENGSWITEQSIFFTNVLGLQNGSSSKGHCFTT